MKKPIGIVLAALISAQAAALPMDCSVQNGNVSSTDCVWGLVTDLEKQMAADSSANAADEIKNPVIADELDAIAFQVAGLKTIDYNQFLFQSLQRYVQNPGERVLLFQLWASVRGKMADTFATPQVAYAEGLNRGVGEFAGILLAAWGVFNLLHGKISLNLLKLPSIAESTEATAAAEAETAAVKSKTWTSWLIGKAVKNGKSVLAVTATGIAASELMTFIDREYDTHIDPNPSFSVVQASLACALVQASIGTMNLDQLKDLQGQAQLLLSQNPDLDNLYQNNESYSQGLLGTQAEINEIPAGEQSLVAYLQPMNCKEVAFDPSSPFMVDLSERISDLQAQQPKQSPSTTAPVTQP